MDRTGVLFIGALGYIASAVMAGSTGLKKGLFNKTGMVTELEPFNGLGLIGPEDMVFGGWDIRKAALTDTVKAFFDASMLPLDVFQKIAGEIERIAPDIFPGLTTNCGRAIEDLASGGPGESELPLNRQLERLREDIRSFRKRNSLKSVMVINLASTEPPLPEDPCHLFADGIAEAIERDRRELIRASTLYAWAAVTEGCPYVNFTPSNGALPPGTVELAGRNSVPVMGNDGKTGETLVKSALAPMFIYRNLEVLSWEGYNILGNMDGRVLEDPENKESKIYTKDRILPMMLGYTPHSSVHINYVPSLDDQKTAWNFIHFRGFMGAKMSMQFIWQGYDSVLAAPLVLDLIRFAELSLRRGESGLMRHLSSFFKAPLEMDEHRFYEQFRMLERYAEKSKEQGART